MKERIKSLDGLKGIACLLIAFFYHYFPLDGEIRRLGPRLVEVFFAISGFGFAYVYKDIISKKAFSEWFLKRYFKIMPLYWITFICCLIIQLYSVKIKGETTSNIAIDFLHIFWGFIGMESGWIINALPVNGPSWFVSTLFLCYILYFLICKCNKKFYFLLLVSLLLFSSCGILLQWQYPFLYFEASLRGYASFCMGSLMYEVYKKLSSKGGAILAYSLIIIYAVYVTVLNNIGSFKGEQLTGEMRLLIIFFFIPTIFLSILYIPLIKMFLETKVMQKIANIAMEIYLWHYSVEIVVAFTSIHETWLGYGIVVITTLIISFLSHKILNPQKTSKFLMSYINDNFIKK